MNPSCGELVPSVTHCGRRPELFSLRAEQSRENFEGRGLAGGRSVRQSVDRLAGDRKRDRAQGEVRPCIRGSGFQSDNRRGICLGHGGGFIGVSGSRFSFCGSSHFCAQQACFASVPWIADRSFRSAIKFMEHGFKTSGRKDTALFPGPNPLPCSRNHPALAHK